MSGFQKHCSHVDCVALPRRPATTRCIENALPPPQRLLIVGLEGPSVCDSATNMRRCSPPPPGALPFPIVQGVLVSAC